MDKELHEDIRNHIRGPLSAVKARGLTNANKDTLVITCLNSIYELINRRAKYGYDTVVWDSTKVNQQSDIDIYINMTTLSAIRDFLIEEGYTVDIDGEHLNVKW